MKDTGRSMAIFILGGAISALLLTASGWILVVAYLHPGEGTCQPDCTDWRFIAGPVALCLFGALISASIGWLGKQRHRKIDRVIVGAAMIYPMASIGHFLIGGFSVAIINTAASLAVLALIATTLVNQGRLGWPTIERVAAGFLVLYVTAVTLTSADSCFPRCDNNVFIVSFLVLGLFGAALGLSVGQLSRPGRTTIRRVVQFGLALNIAASLAFLFVYDGNVLGAVFVIVALTMAYGGEIIFKKASDNMPISEHAN